MSNETTDFFDGIGGGAGAPSPILSNVGDGVIGTIVEMFKRPYVAYENRKSGEVEKWEKGPKAGQDKEQLVILLQTDHRNWQNVSKVPKIDPSDENSAEKPPEDDDGKRAVFVPEGKNIQFAVGRAVSTSGSPFQVGGRLGVKIVELRDTGKGNDLKIHEALYQAPSAGDAFLGNAPQSQEQPASQQQSTPQQAQPTPAPEPAPQQTQQAAPPQASQPTGDPWGTPAPATGGDPWGAPATDGPPF